MFEFFKMVQALKNGICTCILLSFHNYWHMELHSNTHITQYGNTVYIAMAFLMCTFAQKATLVKNYMPGKVLKSQLNFLFRLDSCTSLTGALTNMKLRRKKKFCDPMNNAIFKSTCFLENNTIKPQAILNGTCNSPMETRWTTKIAQMPIIMGKRCTSVSLVCKLKEHVCR